MEGYIFKHNNKFLTKDLFWYSHKDESQAYVFTPQKAAEIILMAEKWEYKPTEIIRSIYSG